MVDRTKSGGQAAPLETPGKVDNQQAPVDNDDVGMEWKRLIGNIPADMGSFLRPTTRFADMQIPDDGVAITLNASGDHCDALAVTSDHASKPMHIRLPDFSYKDAERLVEGMQGYLHAHNFVSRTAVASDGSSGLPNVDLVEVLRILWSQVVSPILDSLGIRARSDIADSSRTMPRIWWCPTGPLSFLPLHASGIYVSTDQQSKQCLSDFAISSYTPSINALMKANSAGRNPNPSSGFLVISSPNTAGATADEAIKVSRLLENHGVSCLMLRNEVATVDEVRKGMEIFPSVHFACQALHNPTNPLISSILLSDGQLQLWEIISKRLPNADFAFLSASHTSMGDKSLPDEVLQVTTGMLEAGYRSAVGTLWSIVDEHAGLIAEYFYQSLLEEAELTGGARIDGTLAARALHRATQRFREKMTDSPEFLPVWVPYVHVGL